MPAGEDPVYKCFVGTRLIGSATGGRFINGARYFVKGLGPQQLTLEDELPGDRFTASLEAVSRHTLLAWAMVYNKAQGCTVKGRSASTTWPVSISDGATSTLVSAGLPKEATCSSHDEIKMLSR